MAFTSLSILGDPGAVSRVGNMFVVNVFCTFGRLWIIGQHRNIILRNTRATIVLGGSQFTRYIPLSKREAKIKNQAAFFCVRQVYVTSKTWRRIWWRVNQPFKHTFSHHVSGNQYYEAFFILQTSDRICSFLPYLNLELCSFSQFSQKNCTHSISRTIKARSSFAQQIIALTTL